MTAAVGRTVRMETTATEKAFMRAVVDYARLMGWLCYHPFDSRRSEPGWPDLAMLRGDRALFVELKTAKGRLTPHQIAWGTALIAAGCDWRVWTPDAWAEIERELAR